MTSPVRETRHASPADADTRSDATLRAADGGFDVRAEIVVSHPRLPLAPTLAETAVRLRVTPTAAPETVVVEADGEDAGAVDAFEARLPRDPTVRSARRIESGEFRRTYALDMDARHAVGLFDALSTPAIHLLCVRTSERGWNVSFETTDRSEVRAFTERLPPEATVEVRRLGTGAVVDVPAGSGLTARQRTVLRTAFERGYFAVPRGCSQTDLAAEFDVSPAAVSQQIRRAVRRLVESAELVDATP